MRISNRIHFIRKTFEIEPELKEYELLIKLLSQLEFNGFITISYLDLIILSRGIMVSKHDWETKFYAKQIYLLIYESQNSYNHHRSEIHSLVARISCESLTNEFLTINKKIKTFKKEANFETDINKIRNKVAGHIDPEFEVYYEALMLLDIERIKKELLEYLLILNSLLVFSKNLLGEYGNIVSIKKTGEKSEMDLQFEKIIERINNNNR